MRARLIAAGICPSTYTGTVKWQHVREVVGYAVTYL